MATKDLLRLGKLEAGGGGNFKMFSGGTPSSGGETGFIRVTATYVSANNTVTVTENKTGYYPRTYIRVGQIVRKTGVGFPDNQTTITSVGAGGNTFVVADAPNANLSTGTTVIKPGKTQAFVQSGSLSLPINYPSWNFTDVTGSDDTEYNSNNSKWAILTQMALTSSRDTNVTGVYGIYEICEITDRIDNTLSSFFITASSEYPEPEAYTAYQTGTSVGISELTLTQSVAPLFHGTDAGVLEGLGFAAGQDQVLQFISKNQGFPYTGSAVISGSLAITGSSEVLKGIADNDFFLIKSGSFSSLKFNSNGVAIFGDYTTLPTAVEGGFAYSASNFYAGVE